MTKMNSLSFQRISLIYVCCEVVFAYHFSFFVMYWSKIQLFWLNLEPNSDELICIWQVICTQWSNACTAGTSTAVKYLNVVLILISHYWIIVKFFEFQNNPLQKSESPEITMYASECMAINIAESGHVLNWKTCVYSSPFHIQLLYYEQTICMYILYCCYFLRVCAPFVPLFWNDTYK